MLKELPVLSQEAVDAIEREKIRQRLARARGKDYWRSLDELADTPEFRRYLEAEFPEKHDLWDTPISRRDFLKIMGASMAMAAFAGCRKPVEKIFPHTEQPEYQLPGVPLQYATALSEGGYAQGVLATSYEGRPIKIEGNAKHPDSLGATDIFAQAAVLSMYDPDRSQSVQHTGIAESWTAAVAMLRNEMGLQATKRGAGLRILTETVTSPTEAALLKALLAKFPEARRHVYEPVSRDAGRAASRGAFGRALDAQHRLENADVILSLDADFLAHGPAHVALSRAFAARRDPKQAAGMNRLYVVEPVSSVTGAAADHRLPLRASQMDSFARALAHGMGVDVPRDAATFDAATMKWIEAAGRDLRRAGRRGLVIAGDMQPESVQMIAHALNAALGNTGSTVIYTDPVEAGPEDNGRSLAELARAMGAGQVDFLLILGANPVFTASADLAFAQQLAKVPTRVHVGLYQDETAELSHWHIPQAHALESWGDLRASDGTVTIQQPLIEPLYGGKTFAEVLSVLIDESPRPAHDIVKSFWQGRWGLDGAKRWRVSVHDGVVEGTAQPAVTAGLRSGWAQDLAKAETPASEFEIVFRPDDTIGDGRHANNGWLQELPKPISKIVWDNAVYLAPAAATRLKVKNGDRVRLRVGQRELKAPVWIQPGQADGVVLVHFGYGRRRAGRVGDGKGFDAYALRPSAAAWTAAVAIEKAHGHDKLVSTQDHGSMEGRRLIREATLEEFKADPHFADHGSHDPKPGDTLYPEMPRSDEYAWGMTIDLNACSGCNACILGCQSENNIPVVGKEQVSKGREMHWIRLDRYYVGDLENPEAAFQPMTCMHCENAPCEPVCPVGATMHSDEGLNEMVYNRCVGTRYCSNNCPYKVRRFNYLQYTDYNSELDKLRHNPDVTVRMRGVMEKCTYCIQRITRAKQTASKDGRLVKDGEIVTACQAACPSSAIQFGNLLDPASKISQARKDPRNYGILTELGTRPRTTYLAKLKNPNPELA